MEIIFPRGRDTICNAFNRSVEKAKVLPIEDIWIVYYDEPKEGSEIQIDLTGSHNKAIADELFDSDIANGYPAIFKSW